MTIEYPRQQTASIASSISPNKVVESPAVQKVEQQIQTDEVKQESTMIYKPLPLYRMSPHLAMLN